MTPGEQSRDSNGRRKLIWLGLIALVAGFLYWREPADDARDDPASESAAGSPNGLSTREGTTEKRDEGSARTHALPDGGSTNAPARAATITEVEPDLGGGGPSGGPGPHVEHYRGRSGALEATARPDQAVPRTITESTGGAPKLGLWIEDGIHKRIGERAVFRSILLDEHSRRFEPEYVEIEFREAAPNAPTLHSARMNRVSGPHHFEYALEMSAEWCGRSAEDRPRRLLAVALAVGNRSGEAYERSTGTPFLCHFAPGHYVPESARIERVGGDIQTHIDVVIERAGRYELNLELYGGDGGESGVAFAHEELELREGRQTVDFLFGGRIIRDAHLDGPYYVRNARMYEAEVVPPHEAAIVREVAETPAWTAASFY